MEQSGTKPATGYCSKHTFLRFPHHFPLLSHCLSRSPHLSSCQSDSSSVTTYPPPPPSLSPPSPLPSPLNNGLSLTCQYGQKERVTEKKGNNSHIKEIISACWSLTALRLRPTPARSDWIPIVNATETLSTGTCCLRTATGQGASITPLSGAGVTLVSGGCAQRELPRSAEDGHGSSRPRSTWALCEAATDEAGSLATPRPPPRDAIEANA